MRNSILVTAAIAFLAGALVLSLAQSEQVKSWFASEAETEYTAQSDAEEVVAAEETVAVENDSAQDSAAQEVAAEDTVATTAAAEEAVQDTAQEADAQQSEITEEMLTSAIGSENTEYDATEAAEASSEQPAAGTEATPFTVDVEAALQDRVIGRADAPIVVEDFSSLTCPHCAFFHNTIFPKVKEKYIDTGKVRWIMRGFPLNEPALRAEMVARCAPNDQYTKLITFMYENQAKWAFSDNPMGTLATMLRVAGISNEIMNACATNTELETAMVKKIEDAATKHQISSTPTFIIDGQKTISGAGTYVGFAYDLDSILRAKGLYEEPAAPDYSADSAVPPASKAEATFTNQ